MLCVKGHKIAFDLHDGRFVAAPVSYGMMHDEAGDAWPGCSVLIGPYRRTRGASMGDDASKKYFGDEYDARQGSVSLPPRPLDEWTEVGEVSRIYYTRGGLRAPGKYQHGFKPRAHIFARRDPPKLYRRGRFLRVELPKGCTVNWRGFVHP